MSTFLHIYEKKSRLFYTNMENRQAADIAQPMHFLYIGGCRRLLGKVWAGIKRGHATFQK
jgi:hypothetical protein